MSMDSAPVSISHGINNLPGLTAASKRTAEAALTNDHKLHHCYFRSGGLHNHLSHHILAAYDLGAPATLIDAIYEEEAKDQRPIMLDNADDVLKPGSITNDNWKEHLGNQKAYAAYVLFFVKELKEGGVSETINKYVFTSDANDGGVSMLKRLVAGALHPFIQLGYAAEFGGDIKLVAEALAQAAIHNAASATDECFDYPKLSTGKESQFNIFQTTSSSGKEKGLNIFEILREVQTSSILAPVMPYKPDALFNARRDDAFATGSERSKELARLVSLWHIDPSNINQVIEQSIWATTLLLAATGRAGKKPRLDFFLMHGLTSSIFLPSLIKLVPNIQNHITLFRHWLTILGTIIIVRGRPHVDATLIMHYPDTPLPPSLANSIPSAHSTALGASLQSINPWTFIIQSALRASDSHTIKSIRSLLYGARLYGGTVIGGVPGILDEKGEEHIKGLKAVDGTLFVRAAGVVLNTLGWLDWGQNPGEWDRSALGWDDAWKE